jgi:hypothetical protein
MKLKNLFILHSVIAVAPDRNGRVRQRWASAPPELLGGVRPGLEELRTNEPF